LINVRVGALPNFPFKPAVHLNYDETVLPMKDGLPKLKDFPASIGGSGETMPENLLITAGRVHARNNRAP